MPGIAYSKQLQRILKQYLEAGEPLPVPMKTVAAWGIRQGLWEPRAADLENLFAEQLSRAAREDHHADPQGRSVRTYAAARVEVEGEQQTLWNLSATHDRVFMETSFSQRRQGMVGIAKQLKTDVDSYNDNHNTGPLIQLSLNLTKDVAEMEAAELANQPVVATVN